MNFPRRIAELFAPARLQEIDIAEVANALSDTMTRNAWLSDVVDEIERINIEVDQRLLVGRDFQLVDLCARRKALQFVLESALSAQRRVRKGIPELKPQSLREVPFVDLDQVTV